MVMLYDFRELWASAGLDQLQVLTGALATPSTVVWAPEVPPVPQWNWTQPVGLVHPQPRPGPQFTVLLVPGYIGRQVENILQWTGGACFTCAWVYRAPSGEHSPMDWRSLNLVSLKARPH